MESLVVMKERLAEYKANLDFKQKTEVKLDGLIASLSKGKVDLSEHLEALEILSSLSEANTMKTLEFIEDTINKALSLMFENARYKVKVRRYVRAETTPCLEVNLYDVQNAGDVLALDFKLMSGNGISQLTSFLFTLCLISLKNIRPLLILDEVLNGFHEDAKPALIEIINLFADNGFQFILVEYSLLSLGETINVVQENGISRVVKAS